MNDTQRWWASRTIWAGIFTAAASLAALFLHHTVSDADVQALAGDAVAVSTAIAGAAAIYGRLMATKTIQPKPIPLNQGDDQ